ncbi:hypothetical protein NSIN_20289 [Nitrosotalea sinensis]|uniref:SCP domain-containing protein n=1 Tax=Nitrosotalea sinensis TaxID=1499975 RepID=A0A2H1EGC3_9ARCH|nr:CAP domain-containing protein [Candidatus Nitrosotalea sinensis]SHO44276.1 hypothetical protein NSIN_20289 [Candidatus Nitrosotalea sinensis]
MVFCRHQYQYTQGYFVCVKCRKRTYQKRTHYRRRKKGPWIILSIIVVAVIAYFVFHPTINSSFVTIQKPNFINIPGSPAPKIIKVPMPKLPVSIPIKLPDVSVPNLPSIIPQAVPPPSLDELKQIALDDLNKYRTQNGLHVLTLGNARSSQIYAEELLQEGCIHHIDAKGEGPMLRYKNNGDTMFLVSENIAGESGTTYGTPQSSILDGNNRMMYDDASSNWGHKRNILDPEPVSVSIGIAYDSQRLVMVQDFQAVLPNGYEYDPSSFQTEPQDQKFCW